MPIKKNLSKILKLSVDALLWEFPNLRPVLKLEDFKEVRRHTDRVSFEAPIHVPYLFVDTLFKELTLDITIRLQPGTDQFPRGYYWIQVNWSYIHPGHGRNGYVFADITMKLDGKLIRIGTEKEK